MTRAWGLEPTGDEVTRISRLRFRTLASSPARNVIRLGRCHLKWAPGAGQLRGISTARLTVRFLVRVPAKNSRGEERAVNVIATTACRSLEADVRSSAVLPFWVARIGSFVVLAAAKIAGIGGCILRRGGRSNGGKDRRRRAAKAT